MTQIVVTMVEGEVDPTRVADLVEAFPAKSADELPEFILATMLVRESNSNRWRVVTSSVSYTHLTLPTIYSV